MASKKIRVVWKTVNGKHCEKLVTEAEASRFVDKLRSLPDVKSGSVRLSM